MCRVEVSPRVRPSFESAVRWIASLERPRLLRKRELTWAATIATLLRRVGGDRPGTRSFGRSGMLDRRQLLMRAGLAAVATGASSFRALALDGVTLPFDNGERPLVKYPQKRPLIG